jgi:hypothetical protein
MKLPEIPPRKPLGQSLLEYFLMIFATGVFFALFGSLLVIMELL